MSETAPERTTGHITRRSASAPTGNPAALPWLPPTWVLAVGLVAVAANLRVGLAGLPPLVETITADLHLNNAAAGILTTLPVLCMGLFAPVAHWASTRWGAAPTVMVAALLMTAGSALRWFGAHVAVLYAATLVLGIGLAVTGTLLPRLVKTLFPAERAGLYTGVYMVAMMVGATVSAALAVPLSHALGGWQGSLASWSVLGVVGLVAWAPLSGRVWRHRHEVVSRTAGAHLPWRSATAWLVAAYLVVQSFAFYSTLAWLAPAYVQNGWDREHSGYLLSVFSGVQVVTGLLMPVLSDRVHDLRVLMVPTTASATLGLAGFAFLPETGAWAWAVLVGLGQGSAFALALVLLVRVSATPHAAGSLSAMGFLVGYCGAALGPLAMGAVRDVTSGFHTVWVLLLALMAVQLVLALALRPGLPKVLDS